MGNKGFGIRDKHPRSATLVQVRREGKETSTPERTTAEAGLESKTEELRLEASSEVVCVARVGAADQRIVSCSLEQASTLDMGKPLHSLVIPGMSLLPCMPSINSRLNQYGTVPYRAMIESCTIYILYFFLYRSYSLQIWVWDMKSSYVC
jgi:hypothetical protein